MSVPFSTIQSTVIARSKMDPTDSTSVNLILSDVNDACSIVASKRNWPELFKTGTAALALADGDKNYLLNTDVDKVEVMAISVPANNGIRLTQVDRKAILNIVVQKSIGGTAQPTMWYYQPESIDTNNLATKQISFNVMPDKAYTVEYWYRALPPLITVGTNYPFFNQNYHFIVENYALWKYAERNPDPTLNPDYFRGEWEQGLQNLLGDNVDDVMQPIPIAGPNPNISALNLVSPLP